MYMLNKSKKAAYYESPSNKVYVNHCTINLLLTYGKLSLPIVSFNRFLAPAFQFFRQNFQLPKKATKPIQVFHQNQLYWC